MAEIKLYGQSFFFFSLDFTGKLSVFYLSLLVKYEGFHCIARL